MNKALPIPEDIGDYLSYDPETGELTWKRDHGQRVRQGQAAFRTNNLKTGHLRGTFKGRTYLAHRVAWFLHYGEQPPPIVDHKNNVPTDNRIANLRASCKATNKRNERIRKDNTSGVKGVSQTMHGKWRARVSANKKTYHLGDFVSLEEATAVIHAARKELHGDFHCHG